MKDIFAADYSGAPFELFGSAHLAALAAVIVLAGWVVKRGKTWSERGRVRFRMTLAGMLVINETLWHVWNGAMGTWSLQTMLPLHLCSVLVWLSAFMLATRSRRLFPFAYFLGLAGATQALLTPDAGPYGFPHFRFFEVMISHGGIVLGALYMTVVERFRPNRADLLRVIVGMNLYMVFVGAVNWALGSNYLYIARKPNTASLIDMLPAWPWYIPVLEGIGLVLVGCLYLPFLRRRRAMV